jgi:transposase
VHQQEIVHTMKSQAGVSEPTRRHHDRLFKAGLVQQSLQPGASVAAIALQNGVNANLLFKWRRDHLRVTRSTSREPAVLLPVHVMQTTEVASTPTLNAGTPVVPMNRGARPGLIELEIAGARLCLRGAVDEASLCSVLRALRQSA